MIDFFIAKTRRGFELRADKAVIGVFTTEADAADMAVRFAQDHDALYAIYY